MSWIANGLTESTGPGERTAQAHPLLGLHIDNGSEFLNAALIGCRRHEIQLSRSRPYHSNDNSHVEQKNGHLVRRLLSNFGLDSAEQLAWLDRLYGELLRPFNKCLQPAMRQIGRIQVGYQCPIPRSDPFLNEPIAQGRDSFVIDSACVSAHGSGGRQAGSG